MAKNIRQTQGQNVYDPSSIEALEFNPSAGSKKVSEVGRALLPLKYINAGSVAYTTDATTLRMLDFPGKCLAVYNASGTVQAITLGTKASTPTALAAGVTDANGKVGIPCTPNAWTYIACAANDAVIADSANLKVFLIDDETNIKQEASF